MFEDQSLRAEKFLHQGMVHGKELIPTLQSLLREEKVALSQIDALSVDRGPGSYTGLRIGLITAKSISHFLRKPLVGVASLDALAFEFSSPGTVVCPLWDARWQRIYTAVYERRNNQGILGSPLSFQRISDYLVIPIEELKRYCPGQTLMIMDKGKSYREYIQKEFPEATLQELELYPKSRFIGMLAFPRLQARDYDSCESLHPMYLRPSYAEACIFPKASD